MSVRKQLYQVKQKRALSIKVHWQVIEKLINAQHAAAFNSILAGEKTSQDAERFKSLKQPEVSIKANASGSKKISPLLIGAFFEDINYAADGGLYAELIQNRDYEYDPADKEGRDKTWNSYKAWSLKNGGSFIIDSISPIHVNNKHYVVLKLEKPGSALVNEGFDGIAVKAGEKYNFSVFTRLLSGKAGRIVARLVSAEERLSENQ